MFLILPHRAPEPVKVRFAQLPLVTDLRALTLTGRNIHIAYS